MRVLIYEPGRSGHRPVYLRYMEKYLPQRGITPLVVTDVALSKLLPSDLRTLRRTALDQGCALAHLMTIDGAMRGWLKGGDVGDLSVPVIGNYYLYSNLWGLKGIPWLIAHYRGCYTRLLVSDPFLHRRCVVPGLRRLVRFVPDTWSREDFLRVERPTARRILGLPSDKKIILLFGEISARKGVVRILDALRRSPASVVLLVAGEIDHEMTCVLRNRPAALLDRVIIREGQVPEDLVATYFCSADAVVSDYSRSFLVSSGAFTRALVAGSAPIVPAHGVNAEVVRTLGFGLVYRTEDAADLARRFAEVASGGTAMGSAAAVAEAERREVHHYINAVVDTYGQVLGLAR